MPVPATALVHVVGLGPAGADLLTVETVRLLESGLPVWLRTERHPASANITFAGTFDHVYEDAETFDEVYDIIVDRIVHMATTDGPVVYAVPGSPMVAERTVELLRADSRLESIVHPALSFLDLAWLALDVDPMTSAVTIVDAHRIARDVTHRPGPFLVTQVHSALVLDDMFEAFDDNPPPLVTLLQRLGTDTETVSAVAWCDLRRSVRPDHLTSIWIPRIPERSREPSAGLTERMVARLRGIVG